MMLSAHVKARDAIPGNRLRRRRMRRRIVAGSRRVFRQARWSVGLVMRGRKSNAVAEMRDFYRRHQGDAAFKIEQDRKLKRALRSSSPASIASPPSQLWQ